MENKKSVFCFKAKLFVPVWSEFDINHYCTMYAPEVKQRKWIHIYFELPGEPSKWQVVSYPFRPKFNEMHPQLTASAFTQPRIVKSS